SGVAAHIYNLMKKGYIQGKGYIVTPTSYVAVVGAINIDDYGVAMQDVVRERSNMGRILSSVGGIGYNIAY
ncbi:carbohydrate kinase, partial [Bifidobacterium pseudocatenulatum]|nr:carbohydrate kinase [Bifidobacterium pseudocatenulatum]